MPMDRNVTLHDLQEELVRLKQCLGKSINLRRSPRSDSEHAPFPIFLMLNLDPPPSLERYDLDKLNWVVRLLPGLLTGQAGSLECKVVNSELPQQLRLAVSQRIQDRWDKELGSVLGAGLHKLVDVLWWGLTTCLASMPECVEGYEAIDAAGATVRRFAMVNPSGSCPGTSQDVGEPQPRHEEVVAKKDLLVGPDKLPSITSKQQEQTPSGSCQHGGCSSAEYDHQGTEIPYSFKMAGTTMPGDEWGGVLPDIAPSQFNEGKIGPRTIIGQQGVESQGGPTRSPGSPTIRVCPHRPSTTRPPGLDKCKGRVGYEMDVRLLWRRYGEAACRVEASEKDPVTRVALTLRPTDPLWPPRGPLVVSLTLHPSYPAPGSVEVDLQANNESVPQDVCKWLAQMVRAQLEHQWGQTFLVRNAVRYLENYAGALVDEMRSQQRAAVFGTGGGYGEGTYQEGIRGPVETIPLGLPQRNALLLDRSPAGPLCTRDMAAQQGGTPQLSGTGPPRPDPTVVDSDDRAPVIPDRILPGWDRSPQQVPEESGAMLGDVDLSPVGVEEEEEEDREKVDDEEDVHDEVQLVGSHEEGGVEGYLLVIEGLRLEGVAVMEVIKAEIQCCS